MSRLIVNTIEVEKTLTNYCEEWEMLILKSGNLSITKQDKVYNLTNGNIAFFAPDEFHSIVKENDAVYTVIRFTTDSELVFELKESVLEIPDSYMQLLEIADSYLNRDKIDEQILFSSLELFILYCIKTKIQITHITEKNALTFYKATDILNKKWDSQISVDELAKKLKISLSNLKRIFAYYTGIGVHEYFTLLKITKAKNLLREGESVTKTAEICGFANQAYFSAAFKRVTGLSPKDYIPQKEKITVNKPKRTVKKEERNLPSYLL